MAESAGGYAVFAVRKFALNVKRKAKIFTMTIP